jgi:hypothetical protein
MAPALSTELLLPVALPTRCRVHQWLPVGTERWPGGADHLFHPTCIDGGKPIGDGAKDQRSHTLRSTRGFHPCEDQVFRHSLTTLDALHLGIGVDVQILAEESEDDSWSAIRQTYHNDGLAIEVQGMLFNRDKFLVIVHLSPLSRGVQYTPLLFASVCQIEPAATSRGLFVGSALSRYDTG